MEPFLSIGAASGVIAAVIKLMCMCTIVSGLIIIFWTYKYIPRGFSETVGRFVGICTDTRKFDETGEYKRCITPADCTMELHPLYYLVYEYSVSNHIYRMLTHNQYDYEDIEVALGSTVTVVYDNANPRKASAYGADLEPKHYLLLAGFIGLALALLIVL